MNTPQRVSHGRRILRFDQQSAVRVANDFHEAANPRENGRPTERHGFSSRKTKGLTQRREHYDIDHRHECKELGLRDCVEEFYARINAKRARLRDEARFFATAAEKNKARLPPVLHLELVQRLEQIFVTFGGHQARGNQNGELRAAIFFAHRRRELTIRRSRTQAVQTHAIVNDCRSSPREESRVFVRQAAGDRHGLRGQA